MEDKKCKNCGSVELVKNRRICKACDALRVKEYYFRRGKQIRWKLALCILCKKEFTQWRKTKTICTNCYKDNLTSVGKNPYKYVSRKGFEHRQIAIDKIGRPLSYNEVVHHVDENPLNNNLENLWVMTRYHHGQLHAFLRNQRLLWTQNNHGLTWENFRLIQTQSWLEITKANVIKLSEIVTK